MKTRLGAQGVDRERECTARITRCPLFFRQQGAEGQYEPRSGAQAVQEAKRLHEE